jgi:predicted CXXCH cytochrome family protein
MKRNWKRVLGGMLALAAFTIPIACSTVTRTVVMPPQIPGATFVGADSCAQCHEGIATTFKTASHSLLQARGNNATTMGCEGCHGPGSVHKESGGAARTIINPRRSPEVCFQCHLDLKGQFNLPSHHPVREGKMSCGDCHNPHKGRTVPGDAHSLITQNNKCMECHIVQRGPFVYEHEASREGCLTCHQPHGTVNARMLVERNQTLCLKCHFQQQTTAGKLLIGGQDHTSFVTRGTCWSGGCHEAIHGSQVNSSLRY